MFNLHTPFDQENIHERTANFYHPYFHVFRASMFPAADPSKPSLQAQLPAQGGLAHSYDNCRRCTRLGN